ncbi:hypothetical protein B0J13DRAFT_530961 [Dactylonectria estremocensis]|uniref:Uncharacterized protein n=1 Tax=Dactylonectria estremocensis TaxID=1079267 RepID=A0A9P9DUL5_9HYPO|nr:hypothetical protein B0J13DRAFT_530961 [Dactylonectria estremocensis]
MHQALGYYYISKVVKEMSNPCRHSGCKCKQQPPPPGAFLICLQRLLGHHENHNLSSGSVHHQHRNQSGLGPPENPYQIVGEMNNSSPPEAAHVAMFSPSPTGCQYRNWAANLDTKVEADQSISTESLRPIRRSLASSWGSATSHRTLVRSQ